MKYGWWCKKHTNKNSRNDSLHVDIPTSLMKSMLDDLNIDVAQMSTCKLSFLLFLFVCFTIPTSFTIYLNTCYRIIGASLSKPHINGMPIRILYIIHNYIYNSGMSVILIAHHRIRSPVEKRYNAFFVYHSHINCASPYTFTCRYAH